MSKRLPMISPTALKMADPRCGGCLRKLAFRYIDRAPRLQNIFEHLRDQGDRMHGHLETYRLTGELPDQTDPEARVATAAAGYWHSGEWYPEVEIKIPREGWVYVGKSDQFGQGFVGDYKFTGNRKNLPDGVPHWWREFEPREMRGVKDDALIYSARVQLQKDPQWIFYGYAATRGVLLHHPEPDCYFWAEEFDPGDGLVVEVCSLESATVEGQWTYVIKPPKMEGEPRVIPVDLEATTEDIEKQLEDLDRVARVIMFVLENYQSANDVPHQADTACGGLKMRCDYREHCDILNEGKPMANLSALLAELNEKEPRSPEPAPATKTKTKSPIDELLEEELPKVNPPESKDVDVQATKEEVEASKPGPGRGRKAKPTTTKPEVTVVNEVADAAASTEFEGVIESANTFMGADGKADSKTMGNVRILGDLIPVGARVKVTVL